MTDKYTLLSVAVIAAVTVALRFLPFLIWGGRRKTPKIVEKLSSVLPFAVMGMLVVYCLKDVKFTEISAFLPQAVSCLVVGVTYVLKRNTLLSIILGTLCYMLFVQIIF